MVKVYIFNKSNNVSRVDIFKKFFQCINSEIYLTRCTKMSASGRGAAGSRGSIDPPLFEMPGPAMQFDPHF